MPDESSQKLRLKPTPAGIQSASPQKSCLYVEPMSIPGNTTAPSPVTPERIMQFAWGYVPPLILEAAIHHRGTGVEAASAL